MTYKCHVFTKMGRSHRAASIIRRLFGVIRKLTKSAGKLKSFKKPNAQLSNSEYHLTAEEIRQIIAAAKSNRDKLILQILAETGLRRSEVTALNVEDFKFDRRLLIVRHGKGNKSRLVPLTPAISKGLLVFTGHRISGPVFTSSRNRRLSARQLNRIVAAAGILAGVSNPNPKYRHITPHLFRHSFARLWKDRRGSIEALSKILGHKSIKTTWDLYGTMSLGQVQKEYQKIIKTKELLND